MSDTPSIEVLVTPEAPVIVVELLVGIKGDPGNASGLTWSVISGKPDSFTPSTHSSTHATGGIDAITPASIGAQPAGSYATATQGVKADTALQPGAAISNISGLQTALDGKQVSGNYATLVGGMVPSNLLPSYVDDVLEYATVAALPTTGETGKIYVITTGADANKEYRWSGSTYIQLVPSPGTTDALAEGSTHLYFTNARSSAAAPVQSVAGRTGTVVISTSDVSGLGTAATHASSDFDAAGAAATAQSNAIQRANHTGTQTASTISDFAATVRSTVLTGLSTATSAAIAATDSVLGALGKLQAQVTTIGSAGYQTASQVTTAITSYGYQTASQVSSTIASGLTWANITGKPSTFAPSAHTHALSDVSQSGATTGQVPKWNGTTWVPDTVSGGSGSGASYDQSLNTTDNVGFNQISVTTGINAGFVNADNLGAALDLFVGTSDPITENNPFWVHSDWATGVTEIDIGLNGLLGISGQANTVLHSDGSASFANGLWAIDSSGYQTTQALIVDPNGYGTGSFAAGASFAWGFNAGQGWGNAGKFYPDGSASFANGAVQILAQPYNLQYPCLVLAEQMGYDGTPAPGTLMYMQGAFYGVDNTGTAQPLGGSSGGGGGGLNSDGSLTLADQSSPVGPGDSAPFADGTIFYNHYYGFMGCFNGRAVQLNNPL